MVICTIFTDREAIMEFLYGFAGALAVFALLGLGFFVGWKAHKSSRVITAEELGEKERRRLIQEQEAFKLVQNYTVERAYGMEDAAPVKEE